MNTAWATVAVMTAVKMMLMTTYHSTDMEVHRNWMAVTYRRDISLWYTEKTSQWTLDYPPLFAWFEWLLAHIAGFFEPEMLSIQAEPYMTVTAKILLRFTVMMTECVLLGGGYLYCRHTVGSSKAWIPFLLLTTNSALVIVDHIHFQYNGFLLGVLVLSLFAHKRGKVLLGGLLFAVLINLKHLYLVLAPVHFVFILRGWVWGVGWPRRLAVMALTVCAVFAASIGPIAATHQLKALVQRLFPVHRGLLHAYWAPNAWAIYAAFDMAVSLAMKACKLNPEGPSPLSSGLVQDTKFAVLPQVGAGACAACVLAAMLPCLFRLWRRPRQESLIRASAYAALCGFMFGFHVHEKASLTVVVLLAVDSFGSAQRRQYALLSTIVSYSMHPLLFHSREYPIKILLTTISCAIAFNTPVVHMEGANPTAPSVQDERGMPYLQLYYLWGLAILELYCTCLHGFLWQGRLPFLPLMLVSVYCSLGITAHWLSMAASYVFSRAELQEVKLKPA